MSVSVARQPYSTAQPSLTFETPEVSRSRIADYAELTKLRVAVLVLVTVGAGFLFAGGAGLALVHVIVGTLLVAGGASALNQFLERRSDALMERTENRPLPGGRLRPWEVASFGILLGVCGTCYLLWTLPQPTAALVALLTFFLYVGVYTPLKPRTTWNTLVGAVPGALPPIIGWAAARGELSLGALPLFLVLFFWQLPHFYAIAWIYREQYGQAGLRMVPVFDETGSQTSRGMIGYALCLLAVSVMPVLLGQGSWIYLSIALLLGLAFLATTICFARRRTNREARLVLRASLLYLPALLLGLMLDQSVQTWLAL